MNQTHIWTTGRNRLRPYQRLLSSYVLTNISKGEYEDVSN
jgi:hypothetical protein